MNKRMRELADQAGMFRDKFGLYQDALDPDDGVDLEKFAELIVQECAQTCLDEGAKWRGEQDITDFKLCACVIKEKFGVE